MSSPVRHGVWAQRVYSGDSLKTAPRVTQSEIPDSGLAFREPGASLQRIPHARDGEPPARPAGRLFAVKVGLGAWSSIPLTIVLELTLFGLGLASRKLAGLKPGSPCRKSRRLQALKR
jgi:hypothetical protein